MRNCGAKRLNVYTVSKQNKPGNVTTYISVSACLCGELKWPTIIYVTHYTTPGGDEILCTCPYQPWGPPSLMYNGYWVFPGGKVAEASHWRPTTSSAEVKKKSTAIPQLPLWAFVAYSRVNFTFTFTHYTTDYSTVKCVHMQKQGVNMWERWGKAKIENTCADRKIGCGQIAAA
jgi:hypothetical protein